MPDACPRHTYDALPCTHEGISAVPQRTSAEHGGLLPAAFRSCACTREVCLRQGGPANSQAGNWHTCFKNGTEKKWRPQSSRKPRHGKRGASCTCGHPQGGDRSFMVFTCGQHMGHMGRMGRMDHMERNCGAQVEDNKMQGIPSVQGVQPGPDKGGPARGGPEGAVGVARGTVHLCAVWEGHRAPVRAVWVWRGAPCTCARCVGARPAALRTGARCACRRTPASAEGAVPGAAMTLASPDHARCALCVLHPCAPSVCSIRARHPEQHHPAASPTKATRVLPLYARLAG